MSRARRANESSSTFPFLAVLVCVMGALIFMLLLISTRIRSEVVARAIEQHQSETTDDPADVPPARSAETAAEVEPPEVETPPVVSPSPGPSPDIAAPSPPILPAPEPPDPDEPVRQEIAKLSRLRANRAAAVAKRVRAAEEADKKHANTRTAIAKISEQLKELNSRGEQKLEEKTRLNDEKQRLTAELVALETDVRKARQSKATESTKFSFVAYDGVSGTTRRPILIECTARGIHFVPEDVFLTPSDVVGFTERQNPLLAGADALAKFWWMHDRSQAQNGPPSEPYVLLIVRPSGTVAYYYARRFLTNMNHPFGYELLEEGRDLDLPPVNPQAQAACRQAVDAALAQRREIPSDSEDDSGDEKGAFRSPRVAGGPGARMTDEEPVGGSGRGAGGSGGEGGRSLRYRPGVGFEVVEEKEDPTANDPFEKAARANRKTGIAGRPGGTGGRGVAGAGGNPTTGNTSADRGGSPQPPGTGGGPGASPLPRGVAASRGVGATSGAAAGSLGPQFPGTNGATGTENGGVSQGFGGPSIGAPTSGPPGQPRSRGTSPGGTGTGPNGPSIAGGPAGRAAPGPFPDDGFSPLTIPSGSGSGGSTSGSAGSAATGQSGPPAFGDGNASSEGQATGDADGQVPGASEGIAADGAAGGTGGSGLPGRRGSDTSTSSVPSDRLIPSGDPSGSVGDVAGGETGDAPPSIGGPRGRATGNSADSMPRGTAGRGGNIGGSGNGGGSVGGTGTSGGATGSASGGGSLGGSGGGTESGQPGGGPGLTPRIDLDPDGDHEAPRTGGAASKSAGGSQRSSSGTKGSAGPSRHRASGGPETGEEFDAMPVIGGRGGSGRPPGERRWGYYSRRASIGFERSIAVRVHADRIRVGRTEVVAVEEGETAEELTDRLIRAVDEEARTWGRPPDSFYWSPSLRMVVSPGGNQLVERLTSPLKRAGLPTKIEYSFEGADSTEPARLPLR